MGAGGGALLGDAAGWPVTRPFARGLSARLGVLLVLLGQGTKPRAALGMLRG
jgi:hypothetical protein